MAVMVSMKEFYFFFSFGEIWLWEMDHFLFFLFYFAFDLDERVVAPPQHVHNTISDTNNNNPKRVPCRYFYFPFLLLLLSTLRWHTLGERNLFRCWSFLGRSNSTQRDKNETVWESISRETCWIDWLCWRGGIKNTPSPHPLLYIFIYFLLLDIVYSLSYIDKSFFPPLFFFLYPTCVCRINPPGSPDPLLTKLYIYIIHLEDEEKPSGHPKNINRTLSLSLYPAAASIETTWKERERKRVNSRIEVQRETSNLDYYTIEMSRE